MKIHKQYEGNYLAKISFFLLGQGFCTFRDVGNRFKKPKVCGFFGPYWIGRSVN